MKKYLVLSFLPLLLISCNSNDDFSPSINLEMGQCFFEINTTAQEEYLNGDDPSSLSEDIKGLKELSRPNPVKLVWSSSKQYDAYRVIVSEDNGTDDPYIYKTNEEEISIYNLKINTTYNLEIRSLDNVSKLKTTFQTTGKVRNIYLDGVTNVRDIGGKLTEDGNVISQGLLFRGGRLNNSYPQGSGKNGTDYSKKDTTAYCYEREITNKGIEEMQKLGIKNEIDLRKEDGNGFPGGKDVEKTFDNVEGVKYNPMPMGKSDPLADNTNKTALVNIFDMLANKDNYPIYFHCNIGTNRTGTVAMLLEGLCGVSYKDLLKDYMFSNFGTICASYRQYDEEEEPRAETSDVTKTNEVYDRIVNANGNTISEKTISVLKEVGIKEETAKKVKDILLNQ